MAIIKLRARVKKANGQASNHRFTADKNATKEDILALAKATLKQGEQLRGIDVIITESRTPGIWAHEYTGPDPDKPVEQWLYRHEHYLQLARETAK
ncbi:MAG TPA: hypothetical protein VFZ48_04450 [Candidatus Saccharimonadales bacterium]